MIEMYVAGLIKMWWIWIAISLGLIGTSIVERGERLEEKRKNKTKKYY